MFEPGPSRTSDLVQFSATSAVLSITSSLVYAPRDRTNSSVLKIFHRASNDRQLVNEAVVAVGSFVKVEFFNRQIIFAK